MKAHIVIFSATHSPFRTLSSLTAALLCAWALSGTASATTVAIGAGTYTENFNTFSTTQEPVLGWDIRTGATNSSLGLLAQKRRLLGSAAPYAWSYEGGAFRNVSSTNISQTSNEAAQAANSNRALGLSQAPTFGDPGAAFNFNFSTEGVRFDSLSIDLLLLRNALPLTTFSLQYGLGSAPTSYTTLASWSDLSIPAGWGSTTFTFDRDDFGSSLDNQSQAWFRVVTLTIADNETSTGIYDLVAIDNFAVSASTVPEPSAYALIIGAGLVVLAVFRRRQAVA